MGDNDYDVGYKRPPKATRFQKGQSGNPRGRRKGHRNFKTELLEEVSEMILIREAGKPKKVTKMRALLKAQTAKAVQGDTRAAALVIAQLIRLLEPLDTPVEHLTISDSDSAIIEAFLKRHSQRQGDQE